MSRVNTGQVSDKLDVLVIGAGPAGCISAAVIHQSGLTVRVVERERFPRFVIGESLLPRCMDVLEDTGFMEVLRGRKFQEKFGAKFIHGDRVADFNFAEQFTQGWTWTWQVPRAEFDLTLAEELKRRGVQVDFESAVTEIEVLSDDCSRTTIARKDATNEIIEARYIVDASGYGRVIPRLFKLDEPSGLDPRRALFAHVNDKHRNKYDEPNRILIIMYAPQVWVWIIPFSSGITSVGFVGNIDYFSAIPGNDADQFSYLVNNNIYLKERFGEATFTMDPRHLEAWSSKSHSFYGKGYVLTGNVTEFLDPIFSSGVMFAMVSGQLAGKLVSRKLLGTPVDWEVEYTKVIHQGVDVFRSYVMAWYDGTLEKIFFAKNPDPLIKNQICSVLAGYVWDQNNPYVREHSRSLRHLAKQIDFSSRKAAS
jgi:flavin-dependent dehydrogenase